VRSLPRRGPSTTRSPPRSPSVSARGRSRNAPAGTRRGPAP
jgi:hypothetical protein